MSTIRIDSYTLHVMGSMSNEDIDDIYEQIKPEVDKAVDVLQKALKEIDTRLYVDQEE